jgi:hypothetical protein
MESARMALTMSALDAAAVGVSGMEMCCESKGNPEETA